MAKNIVKTIKEKAKNLGETIGILAGTVYCGPTANRLSYNNGRYASSGSLIGETLESTFMGGVAGGLINTALLAWVSQDKLPDHPVALAVAFGLPVITNLGSGAYEAVKMYKDKKLEETGADLSDRTTITGNELGPGDFYFTRKG